MALVQKRNPRRTMILTIALIVVVVAGIITLILLRPSGSETPSGETRLSGTDLPIYTDFGESLYTKEQFRSLRDFLGDKEPSGTPALDTTLSNTNAGNQFPFDPH